MTDLNKCPKCGGPADNGHDRCVPPNALWCSCCKDKDFLDMVKTWEYVRGTNSVHIYELAYEAIELRREKYRLEAVIEKMWQAIFHCKKCPPNKNFDPPDCVPEGGCRKCWSPYLEHEL